MLGQPGAVLATNGVDQAAGVLIAAQINQLEIMQQSGLQLDQLNPPAQGLKDHQPLPLEAGQGQLLQQLVEVGDQPLAKAVRCWRGKRWRIGRNQRIRSRVASWIGSSAVEGMDMGRGRRQGQDRQVLEQPDAIKQRLRARFAGLPTDRQLVDEWLAERRLEAPQEGS